MAVPTAGQLAITRHASYVVIIGQQRGRMGENPAHAGAHVACGSWIRAVVVYEKTAACATAASWRAGALVWAVCGRIAGVSADGGAR